MSEELKRYVIFHGGCHGCTRQDEWGTGGCYACCYFDAEWYKPDLNNRPPTEAEIERERIKALVRHSRKES